MYMHTGFTFLPILLLKSPYVSYADMFYSILGACSAEYQRYSTIRIPTRNGRTLEGNSNGIFRYNKV